MGKFNFVKTSIEGVVIVEPTVYGDARGYFMETYNAKEFTDAGLTMTFVQDNESRSRKGVLRGLHFQKHNPQGKLVRVIEGEVFDVAVDIRKDSPTFGQWVGEKLSADNKRQLWIPPGLAHGFLVLSDSAEFLYKTTDYYAPELERCIRWDDPDLAIEWPIEGEPVLSAKDALGKRLSEI